MMPKFEDCLCKKCKSGLICMILAKFNKNFNPVRTIKKCQCPKCPIVKACQFKKIR